ncbi:MAG: tRNA (N(6)-L-threonylcarbamoyladenosine(37)-C(2))-methylthiotransferase MtaB, partial [Coriobacteriaceae bacterium]|nr:tRNA (N(6)-L-threonylcarbamoyladenosine(37)-C(2))-methylthiotransferase MtaB [Coriobacteriaceae bacterium]
MSEPRAVAFVTLGCKVNRAESEAALARLLGGGWRAAAQAAEADVVVVNTCTVTGEADRKVRKAVHRALRECAGPVVVTGCMATVDGGGAALAALDPRVVVEPDKSRLPSRVASLVDGPAPAAHGVRSGEGFRTRAAVKIQDGCDARCAYCIVPDARGPARSVPVADVLAEVRALVAAGTREVVLTGVNLGRFAAGDGPGDDLADLVRAVAAEGPARVRLSSIEPLDITERLLTALAGTPAVCAHLHVPLQSGSDRVLAAMRRGYTAAQYEEAIARAREALPGLSVTTDVIAGFPGESDADLAETLALVERVGFSKLHVFRFSARPGARAAEMGGQVPHAVRDSRAAELRAAGERLCEAYVRGRAGREAEMLVERVADGMAEGTTRDYLRVRFPADGAAEGDLVRQV